MKKLYVVMVLCLIGNLFGTVLNVDYMTPNAEIEVNDKKLEIIMGNDFGQVTVPGKYMLPSKQLNILIPPGKKIISQKATLNSSTKSFEYSPQINSPYHDQENFTSSATTPELSEQLIYLGEGYWGNLHFLRYRFAPYAYDNGSLTRVESISFSIGFEDSEANEALVSKSLADLSRRAFINAELINEYNVLNTRQQTLHLITTQSIRASMQNYIDLRSMQGITLNFSDIEDILMNSPGSTEPEQVRNYLIENFNPSGDNFLLLVGDFETIPIQYLNASPNENSLTPSDFYYSDLTSNFNSDGDNFWGEYSNGFGDEDYEIDFTPEMYVGRIPFSDLAKLDVIFQRIIDFEQSDALWKDKVLSPMAMFNFENQDYEYGWNRTDGADYTEYMKSTILRNNPVTTMYEQVGFDNSPYPSDWDLSSINLNIALNTEDFGFVCLGAHGSPTSSSRLVWEDDYDNNNICTGDERYWEGLIMVDMFDTISNSTGSVFFTQSCLNGGFDLTDNPRGSLGEYILEKKGVATLTATRTGWYKIGWINPGWGGIHSLNYYQMDNYYTHNQALGMSHANANFMFSNYFFFGDPLDSDGIIWPEQKNIYTYILYGDPLINYQPEYNTTDGEILVWEPNGFSNSFEVVNAISETGNWNIYYTDKLDDEMSSLDSFSAVFCLFGFQDEAFYLEEASIESQMLVDYLQNGGKVYTESSIEYSYNTAFYDFFNIWAPFDHVVDLETVQSVESNQMWDYDGEINGLQALEIMQPDATTQSVYLAPQESYSDVIAIKTITQDAITVGASFPIFGLTDETGLINDYIYEVMYTHFQLQSPQDNEDIIQAIQQNLSVYPNPASELVTFKTSKIIPNQEIQIFNIKGQLERTIVTGTSKLSRWDMTDSKGNKLSNGIYFSRIKGTDARPAKFIIMK